jgi:hypothetical protein
MELRERRIVSRFVRFGLVALAVVIAAGWMLRRVPRPDHLVVERSAPAAAQLGAGDVQIFNEDGTVDVISPVTAYRRACRRRRWRKCAPDWLGRRSATPPDWAGASRGS